MAERCTCNLFSVYKQGHVLKGLCKKRCTHFILSLENMLIKKHSSQLYVPSKLGFKLKCLVLAKIDSKP